MEHARTPKEFGFRASRGGGGRYGGGGGGRRERYNTMHTYVEVYISIPLSDLQFTICKLFSDFCEFLLAKRFSKQITFFPKKPSPKGKYFFPSIHRFPASPLLVTFPFQFFVENLTFRHSLSGIFM